MDRVEIDVHKKVRAPQGHGRGSAPLFSAILLQRAGRIVRHDHGKRGLPERPNPGLAQRRPAPSAVVRRRLEQIAPIGSILLINIERIHMTDQRHEMASLIHDPL